MLLIMTTIIYCVIYLVNDTGCQPSYFLYCCHSHIISSAIVKAPDLYRDKIFRVADLKSLSFFSFPSYLDEISLFLFSWSFEFRDFFFPSGWGCWCLAQTPCWRTRSPNLKPQETLDTHFSRLLRHAWATLGTFFNLGHHTGQWLNNWKEMKWSYQSQFNISIFRYISLA